MTDTPKRKLIEVGIPLKTINEESAREKSIRHGHPPLCICGGPAALAAARAVLFLQLVDDPSSHPDKFPTDEDVAQERKRLHTLMEQLVVWENSNNEQLLAQARQEILESTGGSPPPILDPFAGGGTIPEAQRLGLKAHASDLNPVAVLINKALIEFLQIRRPTAGVAGDFREINSTILAARLGPRRGRPPLWQWMRDEAEKRIGHLLPQSDPARWLRSHCDRLDLDAYGHLPQPGMWNQHASCSFVVDQQEERPRAM